MKRVKTQGKTALDRSETSVIIRVEYGKNSHIIKSCPQANSAEGIVGVKGLSAKPNFIPSFSRKTSSLASSLNKPTDYGGISTKTSKRVRL